MMTVEQKREAARRSYYKYHERNKARQRARYHADPERYKAQSRAWHAANPDRIRELSAKSLVRRRYGLTMEQYKEILATQKVCNLCGREPDGKGRNGRQLCVDHDHETGAFRALLCRSCNSMLGLSGDSPGILRKAAEYIEHHRTLTKEE